MPLSADEIRSLEFLQGVPEETLRGLIPSLNARTFSAGATVLRTGDYGDAAYYILEGFAEIRLTGVSPAPRPPDAPSGWLPRLRRVFEQARACDRSLADALGLYA